MTHAPARLIHADPSEDLDPLDALETCTRCAYFFDVDGTLLDLAASPDAVSVPDGLADALAHLASRADGALALVSGRRIASLDSLFGAGRFAASGAHGAEIRLAPGMPIRDCAPPLPPDLRRRIADAMAWEGVMVEDKGLAVAVHYRAAPEREAAVSETLASIVADFTGTYALMPGHCVFEVKRAALDKGRAVEAFMATAPFAGRRPVYVGDDVTDEAAFAAVGDQGGIAVSVGRLRSGAHAAVPEPADVRALLARLAAPPQGRA